MIVWKDSSSLVHGSGKACVQLKLPSLGVRAARFSHHVSHSIDNSEKPKYERLEAFRKMV